MKNWLFAGILMLSVGEGVAVRADEQPITAVGAIQNIEYLQRWYARATDLIGTNDPENIEEGRAIYHRIFTPDVRISASDPEADRDFVAQGPDQWVDVVAGALAVFDSTQHLLGTQIVELESLPDAEGNGGLASMASYLQAWHHDPDRVIVIFLGTYYSKVRYTQGIGWQIYDMGLEKVAGEVINKSP